MSMTRQNFTRFIQSADLNDRMVRRQVNQVVIDEVIDTRYQVKRLEVLGCAPLNCSSVEYLRPVPRVLFGQDGWRVAFENQWFVD